jgi:hypothetical protein
MLSDGDMSDVGQGHALAWLRRARAVSRAAVEGVADKFRVMEDDRSLVSPSDSDLSRLALG